MRRRFLDGFPTNNANNPAIPAKIVNIVSDRLYPLDISKNIPEISGPDACASVCIGNVPPLIEPKFSLPKLFAQATGSNVIRPPIPAPKITADRKAIHTSETTSIEAVPSAINHALAAKL